MADVQRPTSEPDTVGRVEWAPDYGLPIMRPTGCKTGTHNWVFIGRVPKEGDRCLCGLREWSEEVHA